MTEAIYKGNCIDQGNGEWVAIIEDPRGIKTTVPHPPPEKDEVRDAVPGDVYSIQPDGTIQGRPADTNGTYERFKVIAARTVYAPKAAAGRIFIPFAWVEDIPNL